MKKRIVLLLFILMPGDFLFGQNFANLSKPYSLGISFEPGSRAMASIHFNYCPKIGHRRNFIIGLRAGNSVYEKKSENLSITVLSRDILLVGGYATRYREVTKFNSRYHLPCYFNDGGEMKRKKRYVWNTYLYLGAGPAFLNKALYLRYVPNNRIALEDAFSAKAALGGNCLAMTKRKFSLEIFAELSAISHLVKLASLGRVERKFVFTQSVQLGPRLLF